MATYIVLMNFTVKGIGACEDTAKRADRFVKEAKKRGVRVRELYWTLGAHDGVIVLDAKDDQSIAATLMALGKLGNVRTQTLRAFDRNDIASIVAKL